MPDFNLSQVVRAVAAAVPEREAIVHGPTRRTYGEFQRRCDALAAVLVDAGLGCHIERGRLAPHEAGQDRLALILHNGTEYLEAMFGAYAARVAPFNVNHRYVAHELRSLLLDVGTSAVVIQSRFAPTFAAVRDSLPELRLVLQVDDDSGEPLLPDARWLHEAIIDPPAVELPTVSPDDLYILCTGGTTGAPKAVLWRQGDIYPAALGGRRISTGAEYDSLDSIVDHARRGVTRVLPTAPFMHGAAQWMAINAFGNGNTVILPDDATRFDPADTCTAIERERVDIVQIVGDSFARPLLDELDTTDHDLSSMGLLISGGAALSAPVKAALIERLPGLSIMDGLGSSEGGQQANQVVNADRTISTGTFKPAAGMAIVDASRTTICAPGHDGIGWLAQTDRVPLGYLGDPERTAATFPLIDGRRMSIPGDRARLLADGSLELHGRDSVTINTGGEKVFAEEVEAAIAQHPGVHDAIVVGRPSARWGQEVAAVVRLRPDARVDADELRTSCAQHLARYKLPRHIVFVDRIERSPAGKPDFAWARSIVTGDLPA